MKRTSLSIVVGLLLIGFTSPAMADTLVTDDTVWSAELTGLNDTGSGVLTFRANRTGTNITVEGDVKFNIYFATFNFEMPVTLSFEDIPATIEDDNISFSFEYTITDMGMPCPVRFTLDGGAGTFIMELVDPRISAMTGMDAVAGTVTLTQL